VKSSHFSRVLDGFHRDWLHLYDLDTTFKDQAVYPQYTPAIQADLAREASEFVRYVLEEGDGSIGSLMNSSKIPVNAGMASYYGVSAEGADEQTWVPIEISDRRGLLSLASFMATAAKPDRSNPIHRGAFFQREVLCNVLPSLPGNVDTEGPLRDTSSLSTARERLAPLLKKGTTCAGCHTRFNPTGLAFENYDGIGRWRSKENGKTIDASGSLTLDGEALAFDSPLELLDAVAHSHQFEQCYTLQWFRAALGRREFPEDACSIQTLNQAVTDSGGDLRGAVRGAHTDGRLHVSQGRRERSMKRTHSGRRAFLRGLGGIAVSLPWLEQLHGSAQAGDRQQTQARDRDELSDGRADGRLAPVEGGQDVRLTVRHRAARGVQGSLSVRVVDRSPHAARGGRLRERPSRQKGGGSHRHADHRRVPDGQRQQVE